jgi:hypothetical protein
MKAKRKYFFRKPFKIFSKKDLTEYLHRNVFSTSGFDLHVKQVAVNLKIDETIVRDVLVSYFTNVSLAVNTTRKIKTKINIYAFFSLFIEKGNRV